MIVAEQMKKMTSNCPSISLVSKAILQLEQSDGRPAAYPTTVLSDQSCHLALLPIHLEVKSTLSFSHCYVVLVLGGDTAGY